MSSYDEETVAAPSTTLHVALASQERVRGLTHDLYRYPARFSPTFVAEAIEQYCPPDGVVLDPFLGGGTTAVEALARGRRVIGFDINALSLVLTRAKTSPLTSRDEAALRAWAAIGPPDLTRRVEPDPRLRNAPSLLVQALAPWVETAAALPTARLRDAASALLLHIGQWALDGRAEPASADETLAQLRTVTDSFVHGLADLKALARERGLRPSSLEHRRVLMQGPVQRLAMSRPTNRLCGRASLVVTSPPYPGVHVLYHRWQVRGRAETPLPYWLADARDGLGARHYTMGGRSAVGEEDYFREVETSWHSVRRLLAPGAVVLQVVAFSSVDRQLPRYLETMERAGYIAMHSPAEESWREVPNRRWYFRVRPERGSAREVLLAHRLGDGP